MDASKLLWKQWHEQVKQLLSGLHGHQQKVLALCVGDYRVGQCRVATYR